MLMLTTAKMNKRKERRLQRADRMSILRATITIGAMMTMKVNAWLFYQMKKCAFEFALGSLILPTL
jgi:hypothetical protein